MLLHLNHKDILILGDKFDVLPGLLDRSQNLSPPVELIPLSFILSLAHPSFLTPEEVQLGFVRPAAVYVARQQL